MPVIGKLEGFFTRHTVRRRPHKSVYMRTSSASQLKFLCDDMRYNLDTSVKLKAFRIEYRFFVAVVIYMEYSVLDLSPLPLVVDKNDK